MAEIQDVLAKGGPKCSDPFDHVVLSAKYLAGELWLVTKHNESEAYVGRASHKKLNKRGTKRSNLPRLTTDEVRQWHWWIENAVHFSVSLAEFAQGM